MASLGRRRSLSSTLLPIPSLEERSPPRMRRQSSRHQIRTKPSASDMGLVPELAESPHPPLRRDLSFYLVLLLAVLPLWSIPPLSWAFVIYALRSGKIWTYSWPGLALFIAALCEVFFSVYHYNLSSYIHHFPPNTPNDIAELQAAFRRVLQAGLSNKPDEPSVLYRTDRAGSPAEVITPLSFDDPRAIDFRHHLRTWFGKAPWSTIHKHEVYSWLYWSIFNSHFTSLDVLPEFEQVVLKEAVQLLEYRTGSTIPEGSNPAVKPLRLTLDPVSTKWRPFAWYVAVGAANYWLRRRFTKIWKVKFASYCGLEYMLRLPSKWDAKTGPRPIVFMHGLGLGLTQYQRFISHLFAALPNHPVLIPLHPHVSQEIFNPRFLKPMGRREMARCLASLLDDLGWAEWQENDLDLEELGQIKDMKSKKKRVPMGVTMLSHSNGSFAHAWMLKAFPAMVTRSCFVDPVTFCSWEGDLCYNFVYRPCSTGMHLIIKYFVGGELGVANVLQRHFDWTSNALWYDEIPNARDRRRTMFFLGGKDDIVRADRVKKYLASHGIRKNLWYDPDGRHGQALLAGGAGHQEIIRWLKQPEPSS